MAQIAARPATLKLTDANQHDVIAAPGAGKRIIIYSLHVSHDDDVANTIDVKEDTTVEHTFVLPAAGGGDGIEFPNGWGLAENIPLTAQQSGDLNAYINVTHRIVPA